MSGKPHIRPHRSPFDNTIAYWSCIGSQENSLRYAEGKTAEEAYRKWKDTMSDKHATYIGPLQHLNGKGALIRTATHGYVVAQFDDTTLTISGKPFTVADDEPPMDALGYGWHAFPAEHFEVDVEPDDYSSAGCEQGCE